MFRVVCSSVLPSATKLWTWYFESKQTDFVANWHSGLRGTKVLTFEVRRSKVKVTGHWHGSQKPLSVSFLYNCVWNCNQTWHSHHGKFPLCQNNWGAKGQRSRSHLAKTDLEPGGGTVLDLLGSSSFSSFNLPSIKLYIQDWSMIVTVSSISNNQYQPKICLKQKLYYWYNNCHAF